MNVKDLEYLLKNLNGKLDRNIYKAISAGTNSSHIMFLRNSSINHSVVTLENKRKYFEVKSKDGKTLFSFEDPTYPGTSEEGKKLVRNKYHTEIHLRKHGLSTTSSKIYSYHQVKDAKHYFLEKLQYKNVVLKPLNSSLGSGVFVGVDESNFEKCWRLIKEDLSATDIKNKRHEEILVQNVLDGFEARVTIMQGKLVSIVARIPPYVIGDGKNSIIDLISKKNKIRSNCKYLRMHPLMITNKVKEFLFNQSLSTDYIPNSGELVLLSSVSNISGGGETYNITNFVSDNIKEFALDALASIPNMYSGGLDLILKDFEDTNPHVIEINSYPMLTNSKYPTFGQRSSPSKIVFESLIAQHQSYKGMIDEYDIENSEEYIKAFMDFSHRRFKFL